MFILFVLVVCVLCVVCTLIRANDVHPIGVFFLCRQKNKTIEKTVAAMQRTGCGVRVYIVEDNESLVTDAQCRAAGIRHACHVTLFHSDITAWDRALYLASYVYNKHTFYWFMEDDVMFPSPNAFKHLITTYSDPLKHACVCNLLYENTTGGVEDWHWSHAKQQALPLPWHGGMMCITGMSRAMVGEIKDYAKSKGRLVFIEILFPTICFHRFPHIGVTRPPELHSIEYRHDWSQEDFDRMPMNVFHPVKDSSVVLRHMIR